MNFKLVMPSLQNLYSDSWSPGITFANTGTLKTRVHSLFLLSHSLKYEDIPGLFVSTDWSSIPPYRVP